MTVRLCGEPGLSTKLAEKSAGSVTGDPASALQTYQFSSIALERSSREPQVVTTIFKIPV
jgi:hypothetical protein